MTHLKTKTLPEIKSWYVNYYYFSFDKNKIIIRGDNKNVIGFVTGKEFRKIQNLEDEGMLDYQN